MGRIESELERLEAATLHEREYWRRSLALAGMDEAGRGPLAGPVIAACAVMPPEPLIPYVKDSKQLSEKRRAEVYERVVETALHYGVGIVGPKEIDATNILIATKKAFRLAYEAMGFTPDTVFTDAIEGLNLPVKTRSFIRGDQICYSISAASIIAKVTRDSLMLEMDATHPEYGFARHKGYGTKAHYAALLEHGPCEEHRLSFLKNVPGISPPAKESPGIRGEELAAQYLGAQGYDIFARNYRAGGGEVDIIAGDGALIVFAEVKARRGAAFGAGRDALTPQKRRRIAAAAECYMARSRVDARARFDVIEVDLCYDRVVHIKDAFIRE